MKNLPSGSKIHRASLCTAAAVLPAVKSLSEPALAGIAKHEFMRLSLTAGREAALAAVPEEYRESCEEIDVSTFEGLESLECEVALAYDVVTEQTRFLGHNIGRQYGELGPDEIAMSLDLAGVVPHIEVVVGDLKTGRTWVPPARNNWQLRLGAVAVARWRGLSQARVGLLHAPEGSRPWWDVAVFDGWDLCEFADELREVVGRIHAARADAADGKPLEPVLGEHCLYCPARQACPAQVTLLHRLANEPERVGEELSASAAAAAWKQLKVVKQMANDIEAAIRGLAVQQPIDLGEGRVLGQLTTEQDEIDATKARPVLERLFGSSMADGGRWCGVEATKASVRRGLRSVYETRKKTTQKTTMALLEAEAFGALRAAGALTKVPKVRLVEHVPDRGVV